MKQKYTLHIADLQISVITDASIEEVDRISGILDRKMREIYLKSRCPKTEAALLCALDAVADRIGQQAELSELEERCDKYAVVLENFKERNEAQAEELERLRQENELLRSLITRPEAVEEVAPIAPDPIPPSEFFTEVADAQTSGAEEDIADEDVDPVAIEIPETAEADPASDEAPRSRSRVGSMFDLLSFDEVD